MWAQRKNADPGLDIMNEFFLTLQNYIIAWIFSFVILFDRVSSVI